MSDAGLATLSTVVLAIWTSIAFVALAHWSTGGSWSVASGIVRGVRSWADRDRPAPAGSSHAGEPLAPMLAPSKERLWPADSDRLLEAQAGPAAEVEDLGSRRLP